MRLVLALVVAPVLACGGAAPEATAPPPSASITGGGDPGLPIAFHALEGAPPDGPVVATKAGAVTVDGAAVATVDPAALVAAKTPPRIAGLARALAARPGDHAAFTFERDEPAAVVKAVVLTAARAGHPRATLLVRVTARTGGALARARLELDDRGDDAKGERELHVAVSAHGVVLLRWQEGTKVIGDVVSTELPVAKVAAAVEHGWNERGLHHDPGDRRLDRAVVHVTNDTPYSVLLVALDALHAPRRKDGKDEPAPAFRVRLAAD